MTRDEIARLLSVSRHTVSKLALAGMPVAQGGGRGRQACYLPSGCVAWRLAQIEARHAGHGDLSPQTERARRDRAQAELHELRLARERRAVLPREQVVAEGQAFVKATMAKIRSLPARLVRAGVIPPASHAIAMELLSEAQAEISRWTTKLELEAAIEEALDGLADGPKAKDRTAKPA